MNPELPRETFDAGTLIFEIGEIGSCAYAIEAGLVEVLGRDGQHIATLAQGSLIGEVALLDGLPRTASVRAVTDCTLVRIERDQIAELLDHTDPVIRHLLTLLVERFRGRTELSKDQSDQDRAENDRNSALRALVLTRDLAFAIENHQLELFYQPLVAFSDYSPVGFEALVRWRHPALGLIFPDEFIGLAERMGLIGKLGYWVLARAVRDWQQLRGICQSTSGLPPFISVNLSAAELSDPKIVPMIEDCLAQAGMPPHELKVELTETVVIEDMKAVAGVLESLANLGVAIALDDFGTGYGGLDYLNSLPVSCLKIDKVFVQDMTNSMRSHEIVQNSISLAFSLGLTTIAEGIEDQQTVDRLQEMGCNVAQGYFFAKPMPANEVPAWLAWRNSGRNEAG